MLSNRLAFAALAVVCIAAAAGGGYFASRQNGALPADRASAPATDLTPTGVPVAETEALVDEALQTPPTTDSASKASAVPTKRAGAFGRSPAQPTAPAPKSRTATPGVNPADPLPTLDRTWPAGITNNAPQTLPSGAPLPPPPPSVETPATTPKPEDRTAQESPRPPEPPQKTLEELVVPADSVIGLQAETTVTSDRARIEDRVEARVTRDVRVHDTVAIPAGARAIGSVISVERGGKFRERARLGIRFNMLVLADGTRVPVSTETIYRDGDPPGKESAAKIGGATVGGAILGAIFGGGKGAAIGATAGAGAGSATVAASERNTASLHSGEPMTVRILSPISVTIEQK
jgi:hypothetical protein